jgi:hypothetical protein
MTKPLQGPLADSWEAGTCGDPKCGVHIYALDEAGECMAEIVMSAKIIPELIRVLQSIAYEKAVERDE